jgi:hypothetical protein
MRKLKFDRKLVVAVAALTFASTLFTIYAVDAHIVAAYYIYQDQEGKIWWRTFPAGSLFPWPRESGMLQLLIGPNEIDLFIYTYLIKTWLLAGVSVLIWVCTSIYVLKAVRSNLPKPPSSNNNS